MRKFMLAALALVLTTTTGCFTYVDPGHVGVVVDNGGGGVQKNVLGPGVHFYTPGATRIVEYPVFMQTMTLARCGDNCDQSLNITTTEGQPVNIDVALSFEINQAKVPDLYQTFRVNIDQISAGFLKNTVSASLQEVAGSMQTADVIGPKKEELRLKTAARIAEQVAPYGFVVKQFTVNQVRPPKSIVDAINAKNAVEQEALRIKNRLMAQEYAARGDSIEAEGKAKATLAAARAEAEAIELRATANEKMSRSISASLIEFEKAKRWNGQLPNFMGSNVQPYMQIKP